MVLMKNPRYMINKSTITWEGGGGGRGGAWTVFRDVKKGNQETGFKACAHASDKEEWPFSQR